MDKSSFINNYLAHLIAIIALLQVWIIAAWKKWIIKGELQFHPSANIEIGFSGFGSTVSLPGTLRAINKDVFVSEMQVTITRLNDNANHHFTWRAFKSNVFSPQSMAPEGIEIASSFNLSLSTPKPIYVFFASADFTSKYSQYVEEIRNAWYLFVTQKVDDHGGRIEELAKTSGFADNLFVEFIKQTLPLKMYTQLNNGFYWQTGEYKLELIVHCASPVEPIMRSWKFFISEEDEQKLRLNSVNIMKELCGLQVLYNFIYKPYQVLN